MKILPFIIVKLHKVQRAVIFSFGDKIELWLKMENLVDLKRKLVYNTKCNDTKRNAESVDYLYLLEERS